VSELHRRQRPHPRNPRDRNSFSVRHSRIRGNTSETRHKQTGVLVEETREGGRVYWSVLATAITIKLAVPKIGCTVGLKEKGCMGRRDRRIATSVNEIGTRSVTVGDGRQTSGIATGGGVEGATGVETRTIGGAVTVTGVVTTEAVGAVGEAVRDIEALTTDSCLYHIQSNAPSCLDIQCCHATNNARAPNPV